MKGLCSRCGIDQSFRVGKRFTKQRLFNHEFTDCFGEKTSMKLCWDCDWDVMNGGDPFEDETEICFRREEEDYEYDPINNDPPY